jgi:hypothetical protein
MEESWLSRTSLIHGPILGSTKYAPTPTTHESWPALYSLRAAESDLSFWGNAPPFEGQMSLDCCYEYITDPGLHKGIISGATKEVISDLQEVALKSANGISYCSLCQTAHTDLFGFHSLYLNMNQDCYRGLQCSKIALKVFDDEECKGDYREYQLNQPIVDSRIGTPKLENIKMTRGERQYSWVSYHPDYSVTIGFNQPYLLFSLVVFAVSILGNFMVYIFSAKMIWRKVTLFTS